MNHGTHQHARGLERQYRIRSLERSIKQGVVAYLRWVRQHGISRKEAAEKLLVSVRTAGEWERTWSTDRLKLSCRGRPAQRATAEEREEIYDRLKEQGPDTGVDRLCAQMPEVARREMAHIICDYREIHMSSERTLIYTLDWKRAGTVWATDFTEPPKPVDGIYPYILVVRDLSSGEDLMSLPVPDKTAETARNGLISCIKEHGAPLVIKSDNDGAFTSDLVSRYLYLEHGIIFFLTPVRYPCYNGACEAGIGSLKVRAHHESARHNRAGEWTCDDVEAARILVNVTARPRGAKGPSPQEMWEQRKPVEEALRRKFIRTVERYRNAVIRNEGWLEDMEISKNDVKRIERTAIKSALQNMGLLVIRRKELVR